GGPEGHGAQRGGWEERSHAQQREPLIETSTQEMCPAYQCRRVANAGTRTETERGIHILDRGVRLPTPTSEHPTGIPASREAWIKSNSTVSQCRHCTDVFAEERETDRRVAEDTGIVISDFQCAACETDAFEPVRRGVLAQSVKAKPETTKCSPSKCRSVMRVTLDRLL